MSSTSIWWTKGLSATFLRALGHSSLAPIRPKLLSTSDAAKILGVRPERVTEFCKDGRLPAQYLCTRDPKGKPLRGVWAMLEEDVKAFAKIPRKVGKPRKEED